MKRTKKKTDWRKLPRKPAETKRTATIGIRVTEAERLRMNEAARASGQTLVDFILARCLEP
jgi:uncharacterized protein (DUF1778 family)